MYYAVLFVLLAVSLGLNVVQIIELNTRKTEEPAPVPPTKRQVSYAKSLGVRPSADDTRWTLSDRITKAERLRGVV